MSGLHSRELTSMARGGGGGRGGEGEEDRASEERTRPKTDRGGAPAARQSRRLLQGQALSAGLAPSESASRYTLSCIHLNLIDIDRLYPSSRDLSRFS